jgi:hypothetical protein
MEPRRSSRTRNPPKRFTEEFKEYDVFSIEHDAYIGDNEHQELLVCPTCNGKCEKGQELHQCLTCFRRWHLPLCWKGQCDECTSNSSSSQPSQDGEDDEYDTQDDEETKDSEDDTSDSDYEGDEEDEDDDEDDDEEDEEDDDEEEEDEEEDADDDGEPPRTQVCSLRNFMNKSPAPACDRHGP